MTRPYSQDLRDRVLAAYDQGMRTKQIAALFNVSSSWARRVKQRRRESGETTHRPMGAPVRWKVDRLRLAELTQERPDATLAELRESLGVACALSTICIALKKLGFSYKKKRFAPPNRTGPTWSNDGPNGDRGPRPSTQVV